MLSQIQYLLANIENYSRIKKSTTKAMYLLVLDLYFLLNNTTNVNTTPWIIPLIIIKLKILRFKK